MPTVRYTVANGQVIGEKRGGARKFLRNDSNGDMIGLYDATQTKTDTFEYWPFGELRSHVGSASATGLRFQGARSARTASDGTIHFSDSSVLEASNGRFLSPGSAYDFANNSPVSILTPAYHSQQRRKTLIDHLFTNCFSKEARAIVEKKLKNKKCADAIKQSCNGMSAYDVYNKLVPKLDIKSDCNPPYDPAGACPQLVPKNPKPGAPCQVLSICFDSDLCSGTGKYAKHKKQLPTFQACIFLFELGNICECTFKGWREGEETAEKIAKACSCSGIVEGGGVIKLRR